MYQPWRTPVRLVTEIRKIANEPISLPTPTGLPRMLKGTSLSKLEWFSRHDGAANCALLTYSRGLLFGRVLNWWSVIPMPFDKGRPYPVM